MPGIVVVGAQWGDEGKGKVTDMLAERADAVVRFQGGNNAGHTIVRGDEMFKLHLMPSGILHPDKLCVIGNGTVIDPKVLVDELDEPAPPQDRHPLAADLGQRAPDHAVPHAARPPRARPSSASCRSAPPAGGSGRATPTRRRASGSASRTCSTRRS